jgi:hypothetical protein
MGVDGADQLDLTILGKRRDATGTQLNLPEIKKMMTMN